MDCDRQHSMVAKRQADAKFLQTESVPYELKSIEIDTLQSAAVLMKSAKAMDGVCMFDSPGNIYLQGMVPLLGYSDVTPPIYNRADLSRYNTFGNTKQQAEIVRPAFDMIYNELMKLED